MVYVKAKTGVQASDIKKRPEVFNEEKAVETSREEQEISRKNFKNTQTHENLTNSIPAKIDIGDTNSKLLENTQLLERISTKYVDMDLTSGLIESNFKKYEDVFFPNVDFQAIPENRKDIYKQQLAIIVACHDTSIMNLNPADTKELCHLLLPLVSKSKIKLSEEKNSEQTDQIEEVISFADDPAGPLFIRLKDEGIISLEEFEALNIEYGKKGSFENINLTEHSQTIQDYLEKIIGTEEGTIENNRNAFKDDFKETKNSIYNIEDSTVELIAKSYIRISKPKESAHNIKKDYSTAVRTAKNKLLLNDYTVDRLSITFKNAIAQIESDNQIEQYTGLQTIISLKGMAPGKFLQLELQNRKSRIEQLLIKNHLRGKAKNIETQKTLDDIKSEEEADRAKELAALGETANDGSIDGNETLAGGDPKIELITSSGESEESEAT